MRNAFEALCDLASREKWCWKIACVTCGHDYFRLAFREILRGNHPEARTWTLSGYSVHGAHASGSEPLPRIGQWPDAHQRMLSDILSRADLFSIARGTRYPDWLGYLGLGLFYCETVERRDRNLTQAWVPQLLRMLPATAPSRDVLLELVSGQATDVLCWNHLADLEFALIDAGWRLDKTA